MAPTKHPELDPKRVIGYVRASTDRQDLSPHAQRHALVEWCEAHGATLVEVYTDEGVSGRP